MKIYKLDIDTSKPVNQVLSVPSGVEKYGIRVKVVAGEYNVKSPVCQIIDGSTVIEATKKLDDGSFLFELESGSEVSKKELIVRVVDTDEIDTSGWDGLEHNYFASSDTEANVKLYRIVCRGPVIDYVKEVNESASVLYADTDPIVFKGDVEIGCMVSVRVGKRVKQEWRSLTTIPQGTYTPLELNGIFFGGKIWKPANCNVRVVLNYMNNAAPDEEVKDTVESVTIGNETFVPFSLTVDGTEYRVLAAVQNVPSESTTEEPANEENN